MDELFCDDEEMVAKCQTVNGHTWAFYCYDGDVDDDEDYPPQDCTDFGLDCIAELEDAYCGCNNNEQCSANPNLGGNYCNANHQCVTCLDNSHCASGEVCQRGSCGPAADPSAFTCTEDGFSCQDDGKGHHWAISCQSGKIVQEDSEDCTNSGSVCITDGAWGPQCGCHENKDCATGKCSTHGVCVELSAEDEICKEDGYFCMDDENGHSWVIGCDGGEVVDDDSEDCTASGSKCIDGAFGAQCGCNSNAECTSGTCNSHGMCESTTKCTKNTDCSSGICDTLTGKCEESTGEDDLCVGHEDDSYCATFEGVAWAITCEDGEIADLDECKGSTPNCEIDEDEYASCVEATSSACTPDNKGMSDEMAVCAKDKSSAIADCQDNKKTSGYTREVTKTYKNCATLSIKSCMMQSSGEEAYTVLNSEKGSEIVINNLTSVGTLSVTFYASKRDYYLEASDGNKTIELKYAESDTPGSNVDHVVTKTAVFNSSAKTVTIKPKGGKAVTITKLSVTNKN